MRKLSADKMRQRWEHFAQTDAEFFIATTDQPVTRAEFFESGRQSVDRLLRVLPAAACGGRLLEIGCGIGRMTRSLVDHFDHVDSVDISPEMIDRANHDDPPLRARYQSVTDPELPLFDAATFDTVICYLVFQHIPEPTPIQAYLRAIARVLKPEGYALLQFDTRPNTLTRRMLELSPDWMLPRVHRRYIRRYRRRADDLRAWMTDSSLDLVEEHDPHSAEHLFLLRPSSELH